MEFVLKVPRGHVKVEGESVKDLFKNAADADDVFGDAECGLCQSPNLRYVARPASDGKREFTYYEAQCRDCGARLSFGQSQDTKNLFPKRKLNKNGEPDMENGSYGKHNGWHKFQGRKTDE